MHVRNVDMYTILATVSVLRVLLYCIFTEMHARKYRINTYIYILTCTYVYLHTYIPYSICTYICTCIIAMTRKICICY